MPQHNLLGQNQVDRVEIEVLSDQDTTRKNSVLPRSVPNQNLNFYKSMKDIIDRIDIKANLPDLAVQTEITSQEYKFVKKGTLRHFSTQTEECYFPYDEETRRKIASVLGNKLGKSSDKVLNTFQSFLN
mmetsp:Transcript_16518/g.25511  ORF Transcript_16518/g.25511 Transcript_16518/m.25511 type:complete len:129 (+) Transcript_16518:148-534(+)